MKTSAKIVEFKEQQFLVLKRETEAKTIFSLYEKARENLWENEGAWVRFKGIEGQWQIFVLKFRFSRDKDILAWAYDELDRRTGYRKIGAEKGIAAQMAVMIDARDEHEDIFSILDRFNDEQEAFSRRIVEATFPEAKGSRTTNGIHFYKDKDKDKIEETTA